MRLFSKKIGSLILGLFFAAGLVLNGEIVWADPPPWAPAHGYRAKHKHKHVKIYKYHYYPAQQVYYSMDRGGYYYLNNGSWLFSVQTPARIKLGKHVALELGTHLPYTQHTTVIHSYPVIIDD